MNTMKIQLLIVLAGGAALGYIAGSGRSPAATARADSTFQAIRAAAVLPDAKPSVCCSELGRSRLLAMGGAAAQTQEVIPQQKSKPNILVIFGDDIGITNLSCYSGGLMGYETPNIDRIAKEGVRFLHYYGEQSCTAGRAAFLTGQHGIRTGLTKVGFPGARWG